MRATPRRAILRSMAGTASVDRPLGRGAARTPAIVLLALVTGSGLVITGDGRAAEIVWAAALVLVGVPLAFEVAGRIRRGQAGADVIALLAIAGALALGEVLAGAVIALMLSGGDYLDERAFRHARRELSALAERAPSVAHRLDGRDCAAAEVQLGDRLLVKHAELIPVDGRLETAAVVDESSLTGESLPVALAIGEPVRSGASVTGEAIRMTATALAADSAYARIVELVEQAEQSRAPTARIADRAAVIFLPVTIVAAVTGWLVTGTPRAALAVLVVATPCPLILATPIAFVSGVARAARRGVVVKGGAPLERLAKTTLVALDKTGTITVGEPLLIDGDAEIVRLAASVDQLSTHPLATALVTAARARGIELTHPEAFEEQPGEGASGTVDGRRIRVGRAGYVGAPAQASSQGIALAHVSVDDVPAPPLRFADALRDDAQPTVARLRAAGIEVVLLTGDDDETARVIGQAAGIERIVADASPERKAQVIHELRAEGHIVTMAGDGVNDAPALATADAGVALAARGQTVSSSAADAVVLVDDLGRIPDVIEIARRTLQIARQSIALGMGLSACLMVVAALGHLTPLAGALAQEAIDVAAIANALRALRA